MQSLKETLNRKHWKIGKLCPIWYGVPNRRCRLAVYVALDLVHRLNWSIIIKISRSTFHKLFSSALVDRPCRRCVDAALEEQITLKLPGHPANPQKPFYLRNSNFSSTHKTGSSKTQFSSTIILTIITWWRNTLPEYTATLRSPKRSKIWTVMWAFRAFSSKS